MTPTPTITGTPSGSETPTPTVTPTPTATITPQPTETASPTATTATSGIADTDCDGHLTGADTLAILGYAAGTPPGAQAQGSACTPIGEINGPHVKGDANCDGVVDAMDALVVLLAQAGLPLPIPSGSGAVG